MKYIYFAVIDDQSYHEVTLKRYKNFIEFVIEQWGINELADYLNNWLSSKDDVEKLSWEDFFLDGLDGRCEYQAIDENDQELEDLEDPDITFRNFIKEYCRPLTQFAFLISNNCSPVFDMTDTCYDNLLKYGTTMYEETIKKHNYFSGSLINDIIMSIYLLTFRTKFTPKFIVTNAILGTKLINSEFYTSSTLETYNSLQAEHNMHMIGSFNNINILINPKMSNDDNRIIIGQDPFTSDYKTCICLPVK